MFQISGSQESNASNSVHIRAETKKLWPFEDNCAKLCENFEAAKSTYENFARCFAAAKPPASTRVPLPKLKFHLPSHEPRCEIISKLRTKVRNHLQVANQVTKSSPSCEWSCEITSKLQNQPFLAKWTIQLAKSTCVISDICNWLS